MANHKSAEKRARQSLKRRARNRHVLSTMRTYIKQTRAAIAEGNVESAEAALKLASSSLARAAGRGVIHRNQANRKISRLTRAVSALSK